MILHYWLLVVFPTFWWLLIASTFKKSANGIAQGCGRRMFGESGKLHFDHIPNIGNTDTVINRFLNFSDFGFCHIFFLEWVAAALCQIVLRGRHPRTHGEKSGEVDR